MEQLFSTICEVYSNLVLIAISRGKNFKKIVKEADEEIEKHMDELRHIFLPKSFWGLYYVELLASKIGTSLGEAYSLSNRQREDIVKSLLDRFSSLDEAYGNYYEEDDDLIEFQGVVSIVDTSNETDVLLYFSQIKDGIKDINPQIYTFFQITFKKLIGTEDNEKDQYIIVLEDPYGYSSDYVYDRYEIWRESQGYFADYIEKVIENHNNFSNSKQSETKNEETIRDLPESVNNQPEVISQEIQDDIEDHEELVHLVIETTKTLRLLDVFEGYSKSNSIKYKRLVVSNCKYRAFKGNHYVGFNLVIERGCNRDYVGDITFTNFKTGKDADLKKYITSEITDSVVEEYVDRNEFFRFSKPYLLRAQNSTNRTGYGWEWDWSGGYGDYTEGTFYGETTDYFFVGAYITSGDYYEPNRRKALGSEM